MEIIMRLQIQSIKHTQLQTMMGKLWIIYMTHTSTVEVQPNEINIEDIFHMIDRLQNA